MYCNAPTVAYRVRGFDLLGSKACKPYEYHPYTSDDDVYKWYRSCPANAEPLLLPCGRCLLCTTRRRRHWVLRCQHELHYHDRSCFVTLTCDDAHIDDVFPRPKILMCDLAEDFKWLRSGQYWSLDHRPFQLFLKRLRIWLQRHGDKSKIRYYMCGEYGDLHHRPHYHAIIFGWSPPDAQLLLFQPGLCVSPILSQLWPYGYHTVAKVDPACVSYVAGYCDKKIDRANLAWADHGLAPEYVAMSRKPGIGYKFARQFLHSDLYPEDADKTGNFARLYALIGKDGKVKMPRYYDDILRLQDPAKYARLVAARQVGAVEPLDLCDWLAESHRRHAVRLARRVARDKADQSLVAPFGACVETKPS